MTRKPGSASSSRFGNNTQQQQQQRRRSSVSSPTYQQGSGDYMHARQEQRDLARDGAFEGTINKHTASSVPHLVLKF